MSAVALFCCDASPSIGAGHLMRCLSFADTLAWAGWSCVFATNRGASAVVPKLASSGYRIQENDDVGASLETGSDTHLVVVDHYRLDAAYESRFTAPGRTIIAIDDLANRPHDCDVLLDATPNRTSGDYSNLLPLAARTLLGSEYALIARTWRAERERARARLKDGGPVKRIIVSMGGTDPHGATARVIAALAKSGLAADVDIVLGASARHLAAAIAGDKKNIKVHVDPPDLPALTAQADLAIGAAGTSSFERALLGLPAIIMILADNQRFVAKAFADAGAAEVVDGRLLDDPQALGAMIAALAADSPRRAAMSRAASAFTDGRGCARLLAAAAGRISTKNGEAVQLRLCEAADDEWLLQLQRQPATRRYSRDTGAPTRDQHLAWFRKVLTDDDRFLAIVESGGAPIGMIRLDRNDERPFSFEISIAIDTKFHGKGYGLAALALARRVAGSADIIATVLPENRASLALFMAAGYRHESGDRYRSLAA